MHDDAGPERGTIEVGVRRDRLPDPAAAGEDADLVAAIRAEIAAHGPITFARFMERALYEPGHGYYRRADHGPGPSGGPGLAGGDFITAPETHPIFGAAVGRLVEEAWEVLGRPEPFTITEPGAGSGALAAGLLGGLRDLGSPLLAVVRYRPVEVEPARLAGIRERLATEGLAGYLAADETPGTAIETGAVVANEVLDALPVHRLIGRPGGPRELLVGSDGDHLTAVEADLANPDLARRLDDEGVRLLDGQVTEVCLAVDGWLAAATGHLARGVVVLVDYAEEPSSLHGPRHPEGTLRAFARHAVGGDPFRQVGRQDLTATVDLAAVRSAAARARLEPVGETTQAELLAAAGTAGLTDAWLRRPGASFEEALRLRSALVRLMDTQGMGGFRVLVFGRNLPPGATLGTLRRLRPPR